MGDNFYDVVKSLIFERCDFSKNDRQILASKIP